ncbi:MAG TPA: hypothetical protein VJ327_02000 [Patescibacteria group bacterium]|nr:hypothetical protein [Patescibacteria group bacterium]
MKTYKEEKRDKSEFAKERLAEAERELARRKKGVVEWEREMKRLKKLYQ